MAEPLRHLGLMRADREVRVPDVLARLGLAERVLDQFPAELSAAPPGRAYGQVATASTRVPEEELGAIIVS